MNRLPISVAGFRRLEQELQKLKDERPGIIRAIAEAREEGDLRENGGYHAARERHGMLEARIRYLETRLACADIIDLKALGAGDTICFGATVTIEDLDSGEVKKYTLLGPDEAEPEKGSISVVSPVGRALLGKEEGDEVVIEVPRGRLTYEIVAVCFEYGLA